MKKELINCIAKIIEAVDGKLPAEDVINARELLGYNELGEALLLISTQLYEYNVKITDDIFEQIKLCAVEMGLDRLEWEGLEHERAEPSNISVQTPILDQIIQTAPQTGLSIRYAKLDQTGMPPIPDMERYEEQYFGGASDLAVARSLIQNGHGRLSAVAVLRRLFGLSLHDASKVYEDALRTP